MISRILFGESLLWLLLLPFSLLYGMISGLIRWSYRLGIRNTWRAPVPVVVVGNLTVGGNGKTPVVIWLVEQLTRRGIRVGVVSRGYRGRSEHYPLLLNKQTAAIEAGDEPVLIFQRTGVPVAVSPKRIEAVKMLITKYPIQIIITDDGLQHYALARDKEIVVIDGICRFGNGWWLPAGPMRERASRLRSVDAVIINGGNTKKGEIAMRLRSGLAVNLLTNEECEIKNLSQIVAIAGIGHPLRFFTALEEHGVQLKKRISLTDHRMLNAKKMNALVTSEQNLIMTEKDAVKCKSFAQSNWWYMPVSAELSGDGTEKLLQQLIALI